jgi:hypothetical protein
LNHYPTSTTPSKPTPRSLVVQRFFLTSITGFTIMSPAPSLFSASLVSSDVQASLPEGYTFRPLGRSDFKNGHLDVLGDLAYIGDITEEQWVERYDWMSTCNNSYFVLVIEHAGKVVGTGTLIVEKKLYRHRIKSFFSSELLTCSLQLE